MNYPTVFPLTALLAACGVPHPTTARSVEVGRFQDEFAKLADQYELEITWDSGPLDERYPRGGRSARNPADWELQAYAPVLVEELGYYPPSAIKKSGLERIVVCRDLWVESNGVRQNVSGTLDHGTQTLYLCISYTYKVNNRAKQRRVVHHALFHQFDNAMGRIRVDADWEKLNPPGFHYGAYGKGGQHDRTSASGLLSMRYTGFLNRYSSGNLADDKADTFAYMMVVHHYVAERARCDPVIAAKMLLVRDRLARFSPGLGSAFWERVERRHLPVTPYITP